MPSDCATCSNSGAHLRCGRCKDVYYCNESCQRNHWKMHKKKCYKFKQNEIINFRMESVYNIRAYMTGKVIQQLPNKQYVIKIPTWQRRLRNLDSTTYTVHETKIKLPPIKPKKAASISKDSNILDLYLQGRDCQNEMISLSDVVLQLTDNRIDKIASQFLSVKILEFIFESTYKWRMSCFWCKQLNIEMDRNNARHHAINAGAHTVGDWDHDYSMCLFCDFCNMEINYDDITYRCSNKEHDICIKCMYKHKVKPYLQLKQYIMPILLDVLGNHLIHEIIEFVIGGVRQFVYSL